MKKLIVIILAVVLILPGALAAPLATNATKDFINSLFSHFFATGYREAYSPGGCKQVSAESQVDVVIYYWGGHGPDPSTVGQPPSVYLYGGGTLGEGGGSTKCTVTPYNSHDGHFVCGIPGTGAKKDIIYSATPLDDATVRACIPNYGQSTPTGQAAAPASPCSGSDLQITNVQFDKTQVSNGKYLSVDVTLQNQGRADSANENVECGVYPSDSGYIQQVFPLSVVQFTSNCVKTESNVQTAQVINLGAGQTYKATLRPLVPAGTKYTVICGIYPTGKCGAYTNACGNNKREDRRKK